MASLSDATSVQDWLDVSDTAERRQLDSAARLTEGDRAAIRSFCEACISRDALSAQSKAHSKAFKGQSAEARKALEAWMRAHNVTCAVLPRAALSGSDKELSAQGLPPQPPYVRIKRNNCDRTITPEIVDAAFKSVTREALMEQDKAGPEALCEALLGAVRRSIRSFKEQCMLSDSIERGKRAVDVPELPLEISKQALLLHSSFARAKAVSASTKSALQPRVEVIKAQQPLVEGALDKLSVTSQQVEVSGAPYRLVKRSSTLKPKLTLATLAEVLAEAVRAERGMQPLLQGGSGGTAKAQTCEVWEACRESVLRSTLMRLAALPASRSSKVILQRVRAAGGDEAASDNEDEENDEESD
jgi:hypothetical protein